MKNRKLRLRLNNTSYTDHPHQYRQNQAKDDRLLEGVQRYDWPVSTGKAGYSTPSGTFTPIFMNKVWYSREWDNAPMPHAIFFIKDGHAIHGSNEVKKLGKPVSHGCVRISPKNAATLYALAAGTGIKNTQVVLTGFTPPAGRVRSRAQHGLD